MNINNFIIYKIYKEIDKFNNNIIIQSNEIININFIIKIISKYLLCNYLHNKYCNKCNNCNFINKNIHVDILILNNIINKEYFDNINDFKFIINNNLNILPIYSKFKLVFIYNLNLISDNIINFLLKASSNCKNYIKFIFICNNIKKIKLYFRINYNSINLDNYNINSNILILKKIFNLYSYNYIKTSLNLSNNSIIKSYLLLSNNNWNNRLIFVKLLEVNLLNKSLIFIYKLINFKEIEICNPIFWLLTFIMDSINYKKKIYIKNIDKLNIIIKISNIFSLNILYIVLDKLIEYFYIINKNINVNKSFLLMKNILYIENIIK